MFSYALVNEISGEDITVALCELSKGNQVYASVLLTCVDERSH